MEKSIPEFPQCSMPPHSSPATNDSLISTTFSNYIHLNFTNQRQAAHHQTINFQNLNPRIPGTSEFLTTVSNMRIYFLLVIWALLSNYVFTLTNLKCLHVSSPHTFKVPSWVVIGSRIRESVLWKPIVPWLGIWRRTPRHTYRQRKQEGCLKTVIHHLVLQLEDWVYQVSGIHGDAPL